MIQLELHLLRLLLTVFFLNVAAESSVHRFALICWPCCLLRLRKWSFSRQWHQESAGYVSTRRMRSLRQWRPQLKTSCIRFVSALGDCFSDKFGGLWKWCIRWVYRCVGTPIAGFSSSVDEVSGGGSR